MRLVKLKKFFFFFFFWNLQFYCHGFMVRENINLTMRNFSDMVSLEQKEWKFQFWKNLDNYYRFKLSQKFEKLLTHELMIVKPFSPERFLLSYHLIIKFRIKTERNNTLNMNIVYFSKVRKWYLVSEIQKWVVIWIVWDWKFLKNELLHFVRWNLKIFFFFFFTKNFTKKNETTHWQFYWLDFKKCFWYDFTGTEKLEISMWWVRCLYCFKFLLPTFKKFLKHWFFDQKFPSNYTHFYSWKFCFWLLKISVSEFWILKSWKSENPKLSLLSYQIKSYHKTSNR